MNGPSFSEIQARELLRDVDDARQELKHYEVVRNRLMVAVVAEVAALVYLTQADPLGDATGAVGIPVLLAFVGTLLWLATWVLSCYLNDSGGRSTFQSRNVRRERLKHAQRALDDYNFVTGAGL